MKEKIGDRIYKLLKENNYTQKELAKMVGVTEASMCRYLKNEREPRVEVIAKLAKALNTTSDYLINGTLQTDDLNSLMISIGRVINSMSEEEKLKLMRLILSHEEKNKAIFEIIKK